jgi:hypothetical protein
MKAEDPKEIYAESIFCDSGAHGLYNLFVLKHGKRKGKTGRELAKPPVKWSQGDFSYYDLTKGSLFREYCDDYAGFMKKMRDLKADVLLANVDAISNPDLTWEIQRFFEEEHGVQPVPILHYGTAMRYVDRYLDAGRYDLLGVGGLGQGVSRHEYFGWADEFFLHLCPKPDLLPVIRTHGFAMTSWELMCRYPWFSVDSATWVKLSAYGWLYVPRWSEEKGFRYDCPPMMVNFSVRPPKNTKAAAAHILPPLDQAPSPRAEERQKHFSNIPKRGQETCLRWLKHLGLEMGSFDKDGEVKVFGVAVHHRARSIANLSYLKGLEESRPPWPHPLDLETVEGHSVKYNKGFGL